ncbi:leucine-rich repeat domain-containing protein, partial [Candidatus Omnitrophota bacterium]
STDGTNWTNQTNWLSSAPVSEWYHVTVSGGHVTRLNLADNNLSKSIPSEIGNLTNLTHLNLSENQLTGSIPSEIGNLENLIGLGISGNQLTGSIPPEIGNLKKLVGLQLSGNQLTGSIPLEIGNLINLGSLGLSSNQLTGSIPSEIGKLTNLYSLYLSYNQLSGQIPTDFEKLTNLREITIEKNQLSGSIPPEIGKLTYLTTLRLHDNKLTGSIPPEIRNLIDLQALILYRNDLEGSIPLEIGELINLRSLSLSGNQLTGSIPTEIGNLINLTGLDLSNNQLTGTIPSDIGNLINLKGLGLSINQLTGSIPSEIGNLINLTSLNLSNNQLEGSVPSEIGNVAKTDLNLRSNQFTDFPDLSAVSPQYYRIFVDQNRLTFEDIEPNIGATISSFTYAPQDSVGEQQDITVNVGESLTVSVSVGGDFNQYQWKKDGTIITGAASSSYTINSVNLTDAGSYICEITNTIATDLTLYCRAINVTVTLPYQITLASPTGGEEIIAYSTLNITWTSQDVTYVNIDYSPTGSDPWTFIAAGVDATSLTFPWLLPNISSTNVVVRITDADHAEITDQSGSFTILPVTITVTTPNGGEELLAGSSSAITWTQENVTGPLTIEFSSDGGSIWNEVATGVDPVLGTYAWIVPDVPSTNCLVRITDAANASVTDISNAMFTIESAATVALIAPNGGEEYIIGTDVEITWDVDNVTNDLVIELSTDNGDTWTVIGEEIVPASGTYLWTIPEVESSVCLIRITDSVIAEVTDSSDAPFMIKSLETVLTELIEDILADEDISGGIENSLTSKLDNALSNLDKENDSANNILEALINQIEALRGKKLTDEQADELIAAVQVIIAINSGLAKPAIPQKLPESFGLSQNRPNPFNPTTTIEYSIPDGESQYVTLTIYDTRGSVVRKLVDNHQSPGNHSIQWDSIDSKGNRVSSGIYIYHLRAGDFIQTKKMLFMK